MRYVYLLRSIADPDRKYIGSTADLNARLREHNEGKSPYTKKYVPWEIVVAVRFIDK